MDQDGNGFDLVETMRFDPAGGIAYLPRHLARLKASAEALDFDFDMQRIQAALAAAAARLAAPRRMRLLLSRNGAVAVEDAPLPPTPQEPVAVELAPLPTFRNDIQLRHKTSDRRPYDAARAGSGTYETIFVDADGFLTQGSFTNIFVRRGDILLTPPIARAILPGVLRAELLADGRAKEHELRPGDVAGGLLIGNALRGLIQARLDMSIAREDVRSF